ncbi:MAG: AMP-binding protein, partial [Tsuneonella troitsensis]
PWAGTIPGIKFVYSQVNDPKILCDLMDREKVTHSAGVPTVWLAMFNYLDSIGKDVRDVGKLRRAIIGGSAAPRFMIERLMKNGVSVAHAWGMTETSPIGTTGSPPANWDELSFDEQVELVMKQGRPAFGVQLRCVDLGDPTKVLPRDGETSGALQVRGPWVIKRYFKAEEDATDEDQWFDTGDVAVIHPDGTLQLTDRTKDVIKSGGEWISSVELENAAVGHPAIAEAAAIGISHPKWDERPILVCVAKPDMVVSADEILDHLRDKVAKWWMPDAIEFVDEIPHTGTGKISKKDLRERFRDYRLERVE